MRRIALSLFLILALVVSFVPVPVYAATQTRALDGEGFHQIGSYTGGAGDYTNLNSDDDDVSYLSFPDTIAPPTSHSYDFQDFATANNGINYVTLYIKARTVNVAETVVLRPLCRIGAIDYYGSDLTYNTGNYELEQYAWYTNPSTGEAWTAVALSAAEFGFNTVGITESRVSYMYLVVTYTATGFCTTTTSAATTITDTSAILNGAVSDDGGQTVTDRGFVWDTTSRADPGNVAPGASAYANNWTDGAGDYGENPFAYGAAVFVQGTLYFYRAAAQNATGWSYGSELSFTTLDDPAITTDAVSYIEASTARLNSTLTGDGGEACTVSFAWALTSGGPYANWAAIVAAGTSGDADGTWTEGQQPYLDIAGLDSASRYTVMARAVNSVSTQYGDKVWFYAATSIVAPTEFSAIPSTTSVNLSWEKGDGSTNTEVRYKEGTYPVRTVVGSDGVYFPGATDSYIDCGAIHKLDAKLWVSLWFRLDEDFDNTDLANQVLLSSQSTVGAGCFGASNYYSIYLNFADGKLYWYNYNSAILTGFSISSVETSWNAGQWYNVFASLGQAAPAATNGARLRIDNGAAVTNANADPCNAAGNFMLGNFNDADCGWGFKGVLRDVVVGIDDITLAEENALYGGTLPGDERNYWPMDTGTGSTEYDDGLAGDDATLGANCSWHDVTTTADGTLVYLDTGNSVTHSNLTSGTTYYYSAWGESGGFYSDGYATVMATTMGAPLIPPDLPQPPTHTTWFSSPDYTNMSGVPGYGIVNWGADVFEMPRGTVWYLIWMVLVVAAGVLVYRMVENNNLLLTIIVAGVMMVIGAFVKLVPLWQLLPYAVVAVTGIFVGERR